MVCNSSGKLKVRSSNEKTIHGFVLTRGFLRTSPVDTTTFNVPGEGHTSIRRGVLGTTDIESRRDTLEKRTRTRSRSLLPGKRG